LCHDGQIYQDAFRQPIALDSEGRRPPQIFGDYSLMQ
jgi:hypothetical protein